MRNFNDLFKPNDEKETEHKLKEAELSLNELGDRARKCLSHEDFQAYKKQYLEVEEKIIDFLLNYTNQFFSSQSGDASKYGFTVMRYLTKLQDMRSLLVIEKQSKRGPKQEKKNEE